MKRQSGKKAAVPLKSSSSLRALYIFMNDLKDTIKGVQYRLIGQVLVTIFLGFCIIIGVTTILERYYTPDFLGVNFSDNDTLHRINMNWAAYSCSFEPSINITFIHENRSITIKQYICDTEAQERVAVITHHQNGG
jgi:hypothetical protein